MNHDPSPSPSAAEIRSELQRLLASPGFASARRLSAFLEYVVNAALEGVDLKEPLIGVEVYGRAPDYNPKTDSIVRAEASRLRAKLREYYDGEGAGSTIRIDLPKGGYRPAFVSAQATPAPVPQRNVFRWGMAGVAAAVLFAALATWRILRPQPVAAIAVASLSTEGADDSGKTVAAALASELRRALIASGRWNVSALATPATVLGRSEPVAVKASPADLVLTGNVRSGKLGSLFIELQLIHAVDGYLVWTASYPGQLAGILESQKDLARRVEEELASKVAGLPPPVASAPYSKARELMFTASVHGLEESIAQFRKAIDANRRFAPAWAGLARANLMLADLALEKDTPTRVETARSAAQRAVEIDGKNAEARAALGRIYLDRDWDFGRAVVELRQAVSLDPLSLEPTLLYSRALTMIGELAAAQDVITAARARLPQSTELLFQEGSVYFLAHKFDRMEAVGRELMRSAPNSTLGYWLVGVSLEQRGRVKDAITVFEDALGQSVRDDVRTLCALSHTYALSGAREQALATMRRYLEPHSASLSRYTLAYCAALTFAGLNDRDTAFDWLQKAATAKDNSFPFLPLDPRLDGLRGDGRYKDLVALLK